MQKRKIKNTPSAKTSSKAGAAKPAVIELSKHGLPSRCPNLPGYKPNPKLISVKPSRAALTDAPALAANPCDNYLIDQLRSLYGTGQQAKPFMRGYIDRDRMQRLINTGLVSFQRGKSFADTDKPDAAIFLCTDNRA